MESRERYKCPVCLHPIERGDKTCWWCGKKLPNPKVFHSCPLCGKGFHKGEDFSANNFYRTLFQLDLDLPIHKLAQLATKLFERVEK